jgi:hypothetical protein
MARVIPGLLDSALARSHRRTDDLHPCRVRDPPVHLGIGRAWRHRGMAFEETLHPCRREHHEEPGILPTDVLEAVRCASRG